VITSVRLVPWEESYEVRHPDGTRTFFYFDDNPGRRSITERVSKQEALQQAQTFARTEQDKIDSAKGA
jgi:hypothetical protein